MSSKLTSVTVDFVHYVTVIGVCIVHYVTEIRAPLRMPDGYQIIAAL